MIDMQEYFMHKDYSHIVEKFEKSFDTSKLNCDDYWFHFTKLQKSISNNKCPICEVELTELPNRTNTATLDHFRPKADDMYPLLKCEPENYILMCSLCNSTYKQDDFPLLDESKRIKNAKVISETEEEKPLLFNPTEQNPLDFFELAFRQTELGGILELKRKANISKHSYEYKICESMINMFNLGYCHNDNRSLERKERDLETDRIKTVNVKECRIGILTKHYTTFIELANARNDKEKLAIFFKDKTRVAELKQYGFFQFIMKQNPQFSIEIF